jgi:hypothetical protein|tara:strand:+ start:57 stop:254 length:198 start_codon:yes stop_codon:yes gene_type:complete
MYRAMHLIKCSLKAILRIFALITHQGGSVELANKLNDGVSFLPELGIAPFVRKYNVEQTPDAGFH